MGSQFLAGAALAPDEHVDAAAGYLLNGVVDQPHRLAGAYKTLEAAGFERLLPHALASRLFAAAAHNLGQGHAELSHIDGSTEMSVGPGVERLFFNRAGAAAAERDQRQGAVKAAQLVQDGQPTVGFFPFGINVEQNRRDARFACPARQAVKAIEKDHLEPGLELGSQQGMKFFVRGYDADRRQRCRRRLRHYWLTLRGHTRILPSNPADFRIRF